MRNGGKKMKSGTNVNIGEANGAGSTTNDAAATLSPSSRRIPTSSSSPGRKSRSSSQTRRVRATVLETGSDSISTYIKSLGQHGLLYKEDGILLGRQVRMLSILEGKRRELEDELLR